MERLLFAVLVAVRIALEKPVKQIPRCRERAAARQVQRLAAATIQKKKIVKVHLEPGNNLRPGVGSWKENTQ